MTWRTGAARALRRNMVRARLESFIASHRSDDRVLELGCGNSRYARYFPDRLGLDRRPGRGVSVIADAHRLPIRDGAFGVVLSTEMLEHVQDPQRVVDEIERVLRPGGRVILTTRFLFPIHDAPGDYFRFTHYALRHLLRRFRQIDVRPESRPFEGIAMLLQRIVKQTQLRGGRAATMALLALAHLLRIGDHLIVQEFGDVSRTRSEHRFLTSGYHVIATTKEYPPE